MDINLSLHIPIPSIPLILGFVVLVNLALAWRTWVSDKRHYLLSRLLSSLIILAILTTALNPLVSLAQSATETYQYSPSGKILYKEGVGAYEYNDPRHPDAPTKAGDTTYTYDANGNRITSTQNNETTVYDYDGFNHLISITAKNGTTSYIYSDTRRVKKILPDGTSTTYLNELTEVDQIGAYTNYLFLNNPNNQRIATTQNNKTFYNITDHLGSSSLTLNENGSIAQKIDYLPFGQERLNIQTQSQTTSFNTTHTFTDKEKDPESGLIYFQARYYDPRIGMFIQQDPMIIAADPRDPAFQNAMMNPQLLNPYAYAGNNPIKNVDEKGEFAVPAAVMVGGSFAAMYGPNIAQMLPAFFDNSRLATEILFRTAPISGDAINIAESVLGRNALTGEKLSPLDASLTRASVALPMISGAFLRTIWKTDMAQGLMQAVRDYKVNRIIKQAENGAEQIKVGSRGEAIEAGMKFVGEDRVRIFDRDTGEARGWKSQNGLRIFREPEVKNLVLYLVGRR